MGCANIMTCQKDFRAFASLNGDRPFWPPTSRPSGIATTGWVARELPVARALLIRGDHPIQEVGATHVDSDVSYLNARLLQLAW